MSFDVRQWLGRSQRLRHVFSLGAGDSSVSSNRPLGGNTTNTEGPIIPFGKVMEFRRPLLRGGSQCAQVSLGGVIAAVPALRAVRQETSGAWRPSGDVSANRPLHAFDFPYGRQLGAATYISRFGISGQTTPTAFGDGFVLFETEGDPANMTGLVAFLGKNPEGYGNRWVQITATRVSKEFSSWTGGRTGISRAFPLSGASQSLPTSRSGFGISNPGELWLVRVSELNNGVKTVRSQCLFWGTVDTSFVDLHCQVSLARQEGTTYCVVAVRSSSQWVDFVTSQRTRNAYQMCHTLTFPYTPGSIDECMFGEFRSSIVRGDMYAGTVPPDGDGEQTIEMRTTDHDHVSNVGFRHGLLGLPSPAFGGLRESWEYSEQNERLVLPDVRGLFNESVQAGESPIGEITRSTPMFTWQTVGGSDVKVPTEMRTVRAVCLTSRLHEFEEGRLCDAFQFANVTPPQLTLDGRQVNGVTLRFILTGTGAYTGFNSNSQSGFFDVENRTVPAGELTEEQAAEIVADTQFGVGGGFFHPVGEYDCESFAINGVQSSAGLFYGTKSQGTFTFQYAGTNPINQSNTIARTVTAEGHCEFYAMVSVGIQAPGVITPESADDSRADSPDAHRGGVLPCVVTVGDQQARTSLRIDMFFRSVGQTTVTDVETPPNTTTTSATDGATEEHAQYLGSVYLSADQVQSLLNDDEVTATRWIEGLDEPAKFPLSNPYTFGGNVLASPPLFQVGVAVRFL